MEHWYIWQPKVTNALKTINDQLYHKLAADFSLIMGAEVFVSILKHEDSWKICYQAPHSESDLFTFIFSLYDPAKKEYLYSGFEIEEPTIDIHKLLVLPQGQGLATQIMYKFLEKMTEMQSFSRIVLRAESKDEAKFWQRFGFQFKARTSPYLPAMSLDLKPDIGKSKSLHVNIRYKSI
ncbi:GNAT family N-acetyltransferase [Paenibacillus validus]|uniref:GNAT family N-acetyltransferase n=1 Tax=Paenibacillus TaxID=44249 RepID=UPI000FDA3F09|nr:MULTISPECIES: GNAT family N-acetyltransferase [Paenibacillus]MED4601601.1 GNAT family N-acetyltransferase [Paenibacillus validus]MED4607613.1 GNAT family N-acetyltransferase [Paenibacillus validus]